MFHTVRLRRRGRWQDYRVWVNGGEIESIEVYISPSGTGVMHYAHVGHYRHAWMYCAKPTLTAINVAHRLRLPLRKTEPVT